MNTDPAGDSMRKPQRLPQAALTGADLYPWTTGDAVVELQTLLHAHGFLLKIDGDYGSITEAAVSTYQEQQGLRIDGFAGSQTWAALKTTVQPGTRILKLGDTGADVYELQGLLRVNGYEVTRDGIFGTETQAATIAFQQRYQINADSVVGAVTWRILQATTPLLAPPKPTRWNPSTNLWH